jgi:hypothetical protein
VGDLIHNFNALSLNGLVLKYGYIMEHSVRKDTYYFVGDTGFVSGNANAFPPNITFVSEVKLRRRATPFGFGLTYAGFTNQQKAIVAALGLSRV